MKKLFYTAFVIGGVFASLPALATSGACSYHGGVNCSAGSDYDGSVICADGWRDSFVSYASMTACRSSYVPSCVAPYSPGCSIAQLQAVCDSQRAMLARSELLGTAYGNAEAQKCQDAVNTCQKQIDNYSVELQKYYQCLTPQAQTQTPVATPQTSIQPTYSDAYYQTSCETKLGGAAKYDPISKKCTCYGGYTLTDTGSSCVLDAPKSIPAISAPVITVIENKTPVPAVESPKAEQQKKNETVGVPEKVQRVVTIRRINVRNSPSANGKIIGVSAARKEYLMLEKKSGWIKIQFGKLTGWVMSSLVSIK